MTGPVLSAPENRPTLQITMGLSHQLWRYALVLGAAQLAMSLWFWQFSIHLESIIEPWQIGLTVSTGTLALLIAYSFCGALSDILGRKRTIILALVPMIIGLVSLYLLPFWPLLPAAYGVFMLGRGMMIVMSRAIPADEIAATSNTDPVKKFAMMLVSSYVSESIGPLAGGWLLAQGFSHEDLYLLGAAIAALTLALAQVAVRESLASGLRTEARQSSKAALREFGPTFWLMAGGMAGIYFAFKMAAPYFGNLSVGEWNMDIHIYAAAWSLYSAMCVLLSYVTSGLADRSRRLSLFAALSGNAVLMAFFSIGSGTSLMFVLIAAWAAPQVVWVSAESSLVTDGVPSHRKGNALSIYRLMMVSTGLVASYVGALIWTITGSLRFLYFLSSSITACLLVLLAVAMSKMHLRPSRRHAPS
ncbi:MAG: MFS transporter [Candidatus Thorarchaeota archaeon]